MEFTSNTIKPIEITNEEYVLIKNLKKDYENKKEQVIKKIYKEIYKNHLKENIENNL